MVNLVFKDMYSISIVNGRYKNMYSTTILMQFREMHNSPFNISHRCKVLRKICFLCTKKANFCLCYIYDQNIYDKNVCKKSVLPQNHKIQVGKGDEHTRLDLRNIYANFLHKTPCVISSNPPPPPSQMPMCLCVCVCFVESGFIFSCVLNLNGIVSHSARK